MLRRHAYLIRAVLLLLGIFIHPLVSIIVPDQLNFLLAYGTMPLHVIGPRRDLQKSILGSGTLRGGGGRLQLGPSPGAKTLLAGTGRGTE